MSSMIRNHQFFQNASVIIQNRLMGEGFMGRVCTPPPLYELFPFLTSLLKIRKFYLQVLSKLSQASIVKIFQISGRWFPWNTKGEVYTAPKSRGVFKIYWPRQVVQTLCMDLKLVCTII